ncbi:magnesium and cobalt transport protein CorA [Nocardia sp. alder85J]|uniref:magnesium and cobalt transport protein CorA n=1 Tax=Nocardia sp. alder85J TaxID=2862949 RepID=UPI001CD5366E|nr:magnesium and cobalt transport protein CorA [Nocardia sp. alder85J]MCX4094324.1 magnesium and cobalt transport protein CorA [Nocardia sp. alder85J]
MSSTPPLPSFHRPARPPLPKIRVPAARAVVDCAVYVDGQRLPGHFTYEAALAEVRERGAGFVWLGLHEPDEQQMTDIAATYGLHPLAAEDAVRPHQRPKLERYDDTLVVAMRTVTHVEHDMRTVSEIVLTGQILIFVAADFVVAVRHGEHSGLAGVRRDLEADPERLRRGPGAVLHAIADYVVDSYIEVAQAVEQDVDAMEEEIFTPGTTIAIEPIYQLKREIVEMRRAVVPLALPLQMLIQPEMPLTKEVRRYLRDVADHHTAVTEHITVFDESLSAMIGAALAKTAVQQNTDMRKISALVAMAAVPTMIAGIYGMNFEHMPELRQVWGYPAALTLMVVLCAGLLVVFRRSKWL